MVNKHELIKMSQRIVNYYNMNITNQHYIDQISHVLKSQSYQRVVLQLSKEQLPFSFQLTATLRQISKSKNEQQIQFYTLFDSLKKPCCTDLIGAKHVDYDALFHFGYACFSQQYSPMHHYLLPEASWPTLQDDLEAVREKIKNQSIGLILCDQSVYHRCKKMLSFQNQVEIARLPFDRDEQINYQYFGFSYYCKKRSPNVLVIHPSFNEEDKIPAELLVQNLCLCQSSLGIDKIYTMNPENGFSLYERNQNKRLMQRMAQISELQKQETFGILVSNPSTTFCQRQIQKCRTILERNNRKHFTFMMNNLNECKLGNFPEIEAYVVISCYNYSLYTPKDFYRLVVTPGDLEIAFGSKSYEKYNFDLTSDEISCQQQSQGSKFEEITHSFDLMKVENQLTVENAIQALSFYRSREYKGLDFQEKKQIKKVTKGKIGIAEQYQPLQE